MRGIKIDKLNLSKDRLLEDARGTRGSPQAPRDDTETAKFS
jgi:hypothetical protein